MLYNLFENRDFVSVFAVALLAEGVDRNIFLDWEAYGDRVALLAEGVDRNRSSGMSRYLRLRSPSSRRAWIEISLYLLYYLQYNVALLAEGVDRNVVFLDLERLAKLVALLAEGVDRNHFDVIRKSFFAKVALLAEGVDRNIFGKRKEPVD